MQEVPVALERLSRTGLPTKGELFEVASWKARANEPCRIKVCIADRDLAGAQAVADELNKTGKTAIAVQCDVASWDSQVAAIDKAVTEFGRLDYVLPIAGIGERRWMKQGQTEKWQKPDLTVMDVVLTGLVWTVSLAVQQFRRQEKDQFGFRGKSKTPKTSSMVMNANKALK